MAVTAEQIDAVRDWVGDVPDDPTVTAALVRSAGSTDKAALSVLRRRRVALIAEATQWGVAGDYSENRDGQLKALDDLIAQLERRTGDTGGTLPTVTTAQLVRPGRNR